MRIKIKNSDTFVILEGYNEAIESHPILTAFPDIYELTTEEPTENSNYFECTYTGDPRLAPDYYLTRESVGKSLVNEVSNELLMQYKEGKLTLAEVMGIEENLKEVIYSLRGGQFITANYKLAQSSGYSEELRIYLTTIIGQLIQQHYVQ
jgi:hypothetical protein